MPPPFPTRTSSGSMPMRPRPSVVILALAVVGLAAVAVVLVQRGDATPQPAPAVFTWRGIVGDVRPPVAVGQRAIVVLKTPSVAEHVAKVGFATETQERRWTSEAFAAQEEVLAMLSKNGLGVRPDYSFARVLD